MKTAELLRAILNDGTVLKKLKNLLMSIQRI
jgi:hypothetical protein